MANEIPKPMEEWQNYLSLPNTWDSSVSYTQNLAILIYNYNQIIKYLQNLTLDYTSYTDQQIKSLRKEFQNMESTITQNYEHAIADLRAYVDTQDAKYWANHVRDVNMLTASITELRNYTDTQLTSIMTQHNKDISDLSTQLNNTIMQLQAYTDNAVSVLRMWTEQQIKNVLEQVDEINEDGFRVIDPTNGKREHVGTALANVYDILRLEAVTAQQQDDWFTAYDHDGTDFADLGMSALQYDVESYKYLFDFIKDCVYSPWTGRYEKQARVIGENAQLTNDFAITASQYDSMKRKSAEWTDNARSAYEYDHMGWKIFDNANCINIGKSFNGFFKMVTVRAYPYDVSGTGNTAVVEIDKTNSNITTITITANRTTLSSTNEISLYVTAPLDTTNRFSNNISTRDIVSILGSISNINYNSINSLVKNEMNVAVVFDTWKISTSLDSDRCSKINGKITFKFDALSNAYLNDWINHNSSANPSTFKLTLNGLSLKLIVKNVSGNWVVT